MSLFRNIGFILSLCLVSCATPKVVQDYQRDTVMTVIREEIMYRDTVVFVPIPQQEDRAVLPDSDTSHLETMLAASAAWVNEGKLHHTLRQKDMLMPVEVKLPKYIYTKNDSIIRERQIVETVEVEKQLSRWQRFIMSLGYGLLLAFAIWLAVRLVRV